METSRYTNCGTTERIGDSSNRRPPTEKEKEIIDNKKKLKFNTKPCDGCPYRKDCPSGVWDKSEYVKLAEYDNETGDQPSKVFLCHDGDRKETLCRGWLEVHDMNHSLGLRFAMSFGLLDRETVEQIWALQPCGVEMFASGAEAMAYGLKEYDDLSEAAITKQNKLKERHPELKEGK